MDQQNSPTAGTPIYQESQEKNAKWLWLLIILIIIGALVFAYVRGIGPFGSLKGTVEESPSSTPLVIISATPTPEASQEANLDKELPKIRVLNGSGTAGVASIVKDLLEENGWTVASVGNADSYDFQSTVLRFKQAFAKYEDALTEDLSDDYSVSSGEGLEATDSADIEVIVGTK